MQTRTWLRIHRSDRNTLNSVRGGMSWKGFIHGLLDGYEAIAPVMPSRVLPRALNDSDRAPVEIYPGDKDRIEVIFPGLEPHQVGFLLAERFRASEQAA